MTRKMFSTEITHAPEGEYNQGRYCLVYTRKNGTFTLPVIVLINRDWDNKIAQIRWRVGHLNFRAGRDIDLSISSNWFLLRFRHDEGMTLGVTFNEHVLVKSHKAQPNIFTVIKGALRLWRTHKIYVHWEEGRHWQTYRLMDANRDESEVDISPMYEYGYTVMMEGKQRVVRKDGRKDG